MAKRKRPAASTPAAAVTVPETMLSPNAAQTHESSTINFQVITGSYDKTLHGFIVTIPPSPTPPLSPPTAPDGGDSISLPATFTDSFLFAAHTSPIRALTISPPSTNTLQKRILATSSADEHINLYTLTSTLPPVATASKRLTKATPTPAASNPKNKNLGTLSHHLNTPTALIFTPTRSKFITAGLDGHIHILRTRDWAPLSLLKCPKPKSKPVNYSTEYGEGYGPRIDTFNSETAYGGGAGGINDIALHPSQKILLSVGKRSRGMHMWNMMTGRKAGAFVPSREDVPLSFGTEGVKIEWGRSGEEYAIAYERGVVVFGMDSKPKCRIQPTPVSKIHQIRYTLLPTSVTANKTGVDEEEVLAISTEDGRVLFYSTAGPSSAGLPTLIGFLGGKHIGMPGRIKDFETLTIDGNIYLVTAGTDGVVRIWDLGADSEKGGGEMKKIRIDNGEGRQIGHLMGIYETERRVTCLGVMKMGGQGVEIEEEVEVESDSSSISSGDEDDDEDGEDE